MHAFPYSPQTYVVILRQQKIGRKQSTYKFHHSDYVLSCPCNKETPKTSEPLREGGNHTEQFNHTIHAGGGDSSDSASDHLEQPLRKYQQDCQQKAHAQ
jgi:hypothetical protein